VKRARAGAPYADNELRLILQQQPTWPNVQLLADQLQRSENAIRLVYEIAQARRSHLNEGLLDTKTWKQIRRVARDMRWISCAPRGVES
jgi:hypothetical protein